MQSRISTLVTMGLLVAVPGLAKSKTDKVMQPYILTAHTVTVVIDPTAGIDPEDPRANVVAQKDVETALLNWGRYQLVMGPTGADLIVVVRKGHGKLVDTTITNPRQNDRPGMINPTDNGGLGVGAQNGRAPLKVPLGKCLRRSSLRTLKRRLAVWTIRSRFSMVKLRIHWMVRRGGGMRRKMVFVHITFLRWRRSGRPWRREIRPWLRHRSLRGSSSRHA